MINIYCKKSIIQMENYVKNAKDYQNMLTKDQIFVNLAMRKVFVVSVQYIATKKT